MFGILLDAKGREEKVKLAKGETIIFSSSLFHFGCNHLDFNLAYEMKYPTWIENDKCEILSEPRYRAFLCMDHFSTLGKKQQILDSEGQTTIYVKGITDEKYVVNSLIADTFLWKPRNGSRMISMMDGCGMAYGSFGRFPQLERQHQWIRARTKVECCGEKGGVQAQAQVTIPVLLSLVLKWAMM